MDPKARAVTVLTTMMTALRRARAHEFELAVAIDRSSLLQLFITVLTIIAAVLIYTAMKSDGLRSGTLATPMKSGVDDDLHDEDTQTELDLPDVGVDDASTQTPATWYVPATRRLTRVHAPPVPPTTSTTRSRTRSTAQPRDDQLNRWTLDSLTGPLYMTPGGECFHLDHQCHGLSDARVVVGRRACLICIGR